MVSTHPAISDVQNPTPFLNSMGIRRNIGSEGSTYQNVASAWLASRSGSAVSRHSHIMPRIEIRGSEATSAPTPGLRRAISDTAATIRPESAALMAKYITIPIAPTWPWRTAQSCLDPDRRHLEPAVLASFLWRRCAVVSVQTRSPTTTRRAARSRSTPYAGIDSSRISRQSGR